MEENDNSNRWLVFESVRFTLAALIILPVLLIGSVDLGPWGYLFGRLDEEWVQEYLLFSLVSFVLVFLLVSRSYRTGTFFFAIGLSFIGLTHVNSIWVAIVEDSGRNAIDPVYALFYSLPTISIITTIYLLWSQQGFQIERNSRVERITSTFGILIVFTLAIAEYLPWVRDTYRAGSDTWKFKASGSNISVKECCYVTEGGISQIIEVYLPLIGLALLLVISSIGYKVSGLALIPGLIWCTQESIYFLSDLGVQNPLETWSSQEISEGSLSHATDGLFWGYLFVISTFLLAITALFPRIFSGGVKVSDSD